jgi:chromate reductase, NAD(P)H dehydrogenase (quinone)
MKNILSIGGSNSAVSINKKFADFTSSLFNDSLVKSIDLSVVELPVYNVQLEEKSGIPEFVIEFANQIDTADLLVVSLAEHNGNLSSGFKNLLDWTSRIKGRKTFGEKSMLLLATSPGERGGATVLGIAKNLFQYQGAHVLNTFSLPSFYQNFDDEIGITNEELLKNLSEIIEEINLN